MLKMNEYEMNDIASYLEKTSNNAADNYNKASSDFLVLNRIGLFSNGIENIKTGINKISNNVSSLKGIVIEESEKMKAAENSLSSIAEQIEIPKLFLVDDSAKSHDTNDITLQKDDGRSVNEGEETDKEELKFKDSIETVNNLSKISNDSVITEHKINEYTTQNNVLNNIDNEKTTEEQIYDDSSVLEKQVLSSIENNNVVTMQELNNNYMISEEQLRNINNKIGEEYES